MKTTNANRQTIEQEINSLFRHLSTTGNENTVVVREKLAKGSSCKGILSIFSRADLKRQQEEDHFKATPIVRYAFYPNTLDPTRIGSVAIYGENAEIWYFTLRKQPTLFGHSIISVQIENGRRPFVDVRLGA